MRYVFHPEALTEYSEAVRYYTEKRVELAQAFINAIENTVPQQPTAKLLNLQTACNKICSTSWGNSRGIKYSTGYK